MIGKQAFDLVILTTGEPAVVSSESPLTDHEAPTEEALDMMADHHRTLIPLDVASCRRCGGEVYALDYTVDTLTVQERSWVCGSCCATGVLRLSMTLTEVEPYTPAPLMVSPSWTARSRVSV